MAISRNEQMVAKTKVKIQRKNENIQKRFCQGLLSEPVSRGPRGGRPQQHLHYFLKKKYVDTVLIGDGSCAVESTGAPPVGLKAA